jgi:hypothetical protein
MASIKYKGKMSKDLTDCYGQVIRRGEEVVAYRRKTFCEKGIWDGGWEYHYQALNRRLLIRSSQFLITEELK